MDVIDIFYFSIVFNVGQHFIRDIIGYIAFIDYVLIVT